MNLAFFYKLHTINGDKFLKDDYCSVLYDYYVTGGVLFNYKVNVSSDEFKVFFDIVYSLLKEKLSEEDIKKSFIQFIQIVMSDSRDGKFVDIHYFVKHINYLFLDILGNKSLKKARCVSKSMSKSLIKSFGK